ncbi:hypothetical protein MA03_01815 [Infirmifilum uzonense]|uniref:DUF4203 domain-containing protein n=1 Tax=Infirmifilum uzonense TaxID=1550241 RepID=A0A0F7FGF5_9CREN|nr:hypothetical protein [Infirmifilum uzonense]AKG38274.1 hypothetical protein MA03_01815 [Infirmifilum uzonense]
MFGEVGFWDSILFILLGVFTALWGVRLARLTASLIFGFWLGYVFYAFTTPTLKASLTPLVLFFLGFIIGAMIGFAAFKLVVSLLTGFMISYLLVATGYIVNGETALVVLSLAFAAIIYAVMEKILALGFATMGAGLVYIGLRGASIPPNISLIVAVLILILGLMSQLRR